MIRCFFDLKRKALFDSYLKPTPRCQRKSSLALAGQASKVRFQYACPINDGSSFGPVRDLDASSRPKAAHLASGYAPEQGSPKTTQGTKNGLTEPSSSLW
ncbi:uncharacterized protein N7529_006274 [Penicillium soppii]|uniref:uncharacterized protein n=1 Tax=Penicillium soppii TaxID=69789 RepID=UPI002547D3EE|nr:uncharacterized protein N7529_006274 [Penicillium soppii]KAJ5864358.1 hypothetical protein N7529_006274 [Penicillium soppii]